MTAGIHKIAVASRDDKLVYHFGQADRFLIFEVYPANIHYIETRSTQPACDPEAHTANHEQVIENAAALIGDCKAILVTKIGPAAAGILEQKGIKAIQVPTFIDEAVKQYVASGDY